MTDGARDHVGPNRRKGPRGEPHDPWLRFDRGPLLPDRSPHSGGGLIAAWAAGVRTFDTAPHYGVGLSEERLGTFLSDKPRPEFVVSTKVGRLLVPTNLDVEGAEGFYGTPRRTRVRDYSRDGVRRWIEESCQRLGLDRVDIALIHDPDDYWEAAIEEAYPALEELRSEGVVSAIGAGMNQAAMLERFVTESDIDCVLVAGCFSLIEESATTSLFPMCRKRAVGVLAAGVLRKRDPREPQGGKPLPLRRSAGRRHSSSRPYSELVRPIPRRPPGGRTSLRTRSPRRDGRRHRCPISEERSSERPQPAGGRAARTV